MKHRKYFTVVYVVIILFAIKNYVNGQNINVCYNSSKEITLQTSDIRWMYVWEKKNPLASSWNLVGTGISINIDSITQNIDIRCSADTNSDGVGDSVVYQVQLVPYQELVAANISGGGFICHGSISPDLYVTDLATGGGDNYSYQWMYSDNGESSWVNIPNAVQTTLAGQMLTSARYYRLQTTSTMGCGTKYSNVTQVNVYNPLIPPVLGIDNSSICYDSFPSPLFMVSEAQGGIGNFSLQWQQEVNGSFVDIEGATAEIYQPSALRFTSTYRLSATNACGTVFSSPLTVIVYPILESGTIETEKTVCYNTSTTISFVNIPTGGGEQYNYQWQYSENGVTWNNISTSSVSSSLITQNLISTTYYRCIVSSVLGCSSDTTNVCTARVLNPIVAGTIAHDTVVCYNTSPGLIRMTIDASGGKEPYTYQWQTSTNGSDWANVVDATSSSYQVPLLTSSRYYKLNQISSMGCGTVSTNMIMIGVLPNITPASIETMTTTGLCYDSIPANLNISMSPTGADGMFSYQWQESVNGEWNSILGATASSYQPVALRETHSYRLITVSDYGCGSRISNEVSINVFPRINAGTLSNQLLCYKESTTIMSNPVGGGNSYTYQWQQSVDDINWNDISMANGDSYTTPELIDTANYRLIVASALGCSSDTTNSVEIAVLPPFVAGEIAHDTTICYNTSPDLLRMTTDAIGGMQPYTYQWQVSTDNANFTDITLAENINYQPSTLVQTQYYRLQFTSFLGCGTLYSDTVVVNVYDDLTIPVISSNTQTTICYDSVPQELFILTDPTGGNGIFTHQWQMLSGNLWTNIEEDANDTIYQPKNLTDTISYRLISTSTYGCGEVVSEPYTINVYPIIQAGTISGITPICYNTESTISFALFPQGGGDTYTYQWQQSVDDINWNDISMANGDRYTTPELIDTANYRLIVASALGCSSDTTNSVEIAVLPPFVAGEIAHDTTICYNTSPDLLRMITDAIGGMQPYTYQWQVSTDNANFTDIALAENINYQPSTLVQTQYYRLQFTSSLGCGTLYSDTVVVNVYDDLTIPVISSNTQTTICYDSIPQELFTLTSPTGGNGIFTHQWQVSNGNEWMNISGANTTEYQPENMKDTLSYRLVSTSAYGCGDAISEPYTINVYPIIQAGAISGISPICYNTESPISFALHPQGGGSSYTYQWQSSSDNIVFTDIVDAEDTSYYNTGNIIDTTFYRAIVLSNYGCSQDTTNSYAIAVRPEFLPGTIATHLDSACYGEKPNYRIDLIDPCIGGAEPYSYQWIMWTDTTNMSIAPHGNTAYYQPDTIYDTTYYKLIFISSDNCGEVESNIHTIKMNPLPIPHNIEGMDTVCYTQYETYTLPTACNDYSYSWTTENGNGEVTYLTPSNDSVEIYWKNSQTLDKIIVEVEDNVTGCKSNNYKQVLTRSTSAPSRTIVIRKPNSNILICQEESPSLYYQWGYTVKATGEEVVIENSNRRYVLLPHEFDSITYSYWVELLPRKSSYCYSRSYYNPLNDSQIEEPSSSKVIVPSIANYVVPITINNRDENSVYCEAYTISGILVHQKDLGKAPYITYNIESLRKNSLYVVRVKVGNEIFIYKTFVK